MTLNQIQQEFENFLARHNLKKTLQATDIVKTANQVSNNKFKIVSFKNGKLKIMVTDNVERYWIEKNKTELLKEINQQLGQEKVKDVSFQIIQEEI